MADKVIVGCWVCGKHGGLQYQRKLKDFIHISDFGALRSLR